MSRLISSFEVKPAQPPGATIQARPGAPLPPGGGKTAGQGRIYLDLLLKMIPAEIVTLYTFAINLAPQTKVSSAPWIIFSGSWILTPILLGLQESKPTNPNWKVAWWTRLGLATVAFPLWAYATTGERLPGITYNGVAALIVVAFYAVIAGAIAKAVAPK
jgi:hypothetical protein